MMDLALTLEPNGTAHDDVVLVFAGVSHRCDSYYFALDQGLHPDREDDAKVRAVVRRLLEQWRQAVASLAPGETVYLPYDFSDQCTAWLRCSRIAGTHHVEIAHGWSSLEGWSIVPSELGNTMKSVRGFHADSAPISAEVKDVLEAIDESLIRLDPNGAHD